MSKNLVIVESPAKAQTIAKYLGSDFTVLSSIGHIRSIAKKTKDGTPPIDTEHDFKTIYEIDIDKKKTISQLKKAVKAAQTVWLATDEDREGEAIAWHLCEVLGLKPESTNRIVFHEITKDAISQAIKSPRTVDMELVEAQQARQILDRLVGFELSPVIWQKVPGGKSAGRVQSPAVRLLVEREREIQQFESSALYKVSAEFNHQSSTFKAELSEKLDSEEVASALLNNIKDSIFTVANVKTSPSRRNPGAPFTTSTLQQEASSKLGYSAKATMSSAQKLYQEGKITYMRTDSTTLSSQALASIKNYIETKFGSNYSNHRQFKTKSASAQEAHEAIRPTDITLEHASSNSYDQKLYELIRRRTLASQMSSAELEKTTITIDIKGDNHTFKASGEAIIFDGFLKVYPASKKDPDILPVLQNGEILDLSIITARQTFSKPPARYTEGSLVKKLEELGIGRPSTYATIINTIQVRQYAEKGEKEGEERKLIELSASPSGSVVKAEVTEQTGSDKGKLVPTSIGLMISDFLTEHFNQIVDYSFTANVEEEFDQIAIGKLDKTKMLRDFYTPFHQLVGGAKDIDRAKVAKATEVGQDPKTGQTIYARLGRFGPMLQLGEAEGDVKPIFAPMPKGYRVDTVTLEAALKAFLLPRTVGTTTEGLPIKANIGRFGPYIQIDNPKDGSKLYVSIKPLDPHQITLEEALELYQAKLKAEAEKNITDFGDGIKVLNGRFGPYISDGIKNAKVPKDTDPKSITHDQAKKLLSEAPVKPNRFKKRAVKASKKPRTKAGKKPGSTR